MKDQSPVNVDESKSEKYNRAVDLFIESVHKPDTALRSCAHNQRCYNELMEVRQQVLDYAYRLRAAEPIPVIDGISYEMVHDSEGC